MFIRELTIRYRRRNVPKKAYPYVGSQVTSPESTARLFADMQKEPVEKFYAVHLNSQNIVESFQIISIGTVTSAAAYPSEVFKGALLANAACVICIHNHPSGIVKPSSTDLELTEELKEVSKIVKVKFLDHIIIGQNGYYSIIHKRYGSLY